ncbi:hypothetical protein B0T14DRAFT_211124 [Immersiella caudata]|uniref:Uncharacterized protein n=1 Tax=Immersiella caudata TaxID=314043 RepID=A0AA39WQD4_9PEZI|nr:hypothetical protein B0T14DRAFT_211124 [Immersiella caudata]
MKCLSSWRRDGPRDSWEIGLDPETYPCKGAPLHFAARNGQREAVEWLLEHGASVDVSSLHLADLAGPKSIAHNSVPPQRKPETLSCQKNHSASILRLLPCGITITLFCGCLLATAQLSIKCYEGWNLGALTALHAASRLDYDHMIDFIVHQPGCGDASATGDNKTPLYLTMQKRGNDQTITMLVHSGARVNMRS